MDWTVELEGSYHISARRIVELDKLESSLSDWLAYIAKLTETCANAEWNCIVCDLWPEDGGRLIAYVQLVQEAVGLDIGFRVCANLDMEQLWGIPDYLDEDVLYQLIDSLWIRLRKAANLEPARSALHRLSESQAFQIYGTYYGESLESGAGVKLLELTP